MTSLLPPSTPSRVADLEESGSDPDRWNRVGCNFQQRGQITQAISQYRKALKLDSTHAKANFNLAICLCELARRQEKVGSNKIKEAFWTKASRHYLEAISTLKLERASLPFASTHDANGTTEKSNEMYTDALINLGVLHLNLGKLKDAEVMIEMALGEPSISWCGHRDACWNLNSILRRQGRKDEAIDRTWEHIIQKLNYDGQKGIFPILDCGVKDRQRVHGDSIQLAIVCVKWGTKYGLDYVKILRDSVKRNLSSFETFSEGKLLSYEFYCLTDDKELLANDGRGVEGVKAIPLEHGWTGWWNKLCLFSSTFKASVGQGFASLSSGTPCARRVMYIDLDTVITGSLDEIVMYNGDFAILSTDGLDNEGSDFSDGYNSSVVLWNFDEIDLESHVYAPLKEHFKVVNHFVHRLDHWLEMTVKNADLLQLLFPQQILEYNHDCASIHDSAGITPKTEVASVRSLTGLPENSRIVNFPLAPKPHEVKDKHPWIQQHWAYTA